MTSTNVTHAQLVEAIKVYRSYGSKIRAEVKAGRPDLFIDRNRRFQKVLVGKLAEAGHMELVLALADEQVGLDGIAFAKALYPSYEAKSREVLRNARRRIKAMLSDVKADEALATLPTEVAPAELYMRREDSTRVFRVVGTELGGVWLQALERSNDPIIRYGRELIEDGWVACEADGNLPPRDVPGTIFVPEDATLAELATVWRGGSALWISAAETGAVPEIAEYESARRIQDAVNAELLRREQSGLRSALVCEAAADYNRVILKRNGKQVPKHVLDELVDVRIGIARHLGLFGHLVRD